jgi:Zn-dependent peptidase ImmA (M78 family)
MRFLSNQLLEARSLELTNVWAEALGIGSGIPINIESIATDFFGFELRRTSLPEGTIAELRLNEEVILLDAQENRNRARSRFSIAHEIGHLTLHSYLGPTVFCRTTDSSRLELQANRFASALLMPAPLLMEHLAITLGSIGTFARHVAQADRLAGARWLAHLYKASPPSEDKLRALARRFDISLQALQLRLQQLRVTSV